MDQVQLSPEAIKFLREAARKDLYFLAKGILGFSKLVGHIHKPLCDLLQDQESKRKEVILPRGWFKTTIATIAYPIWLAIQEPSSDRGCNERILICQNTHNNARSKLKSIREIWETCGLLRALFPELLPDKRCTWTQDSLTLKRNRTYPEGTFECAGTRTQLASRHYTRIIEDDTVAPDLDEVGMDNLIPSKDDIDQAIGFHRYLVPPLLVHPTDEVLVIGTRWFQLDLLSWIADNEKDVKSYVRASKEDDLGNPDEGGTITFPERFPQKVLDGLREKMGPYMYSCLYMNTPLRSEEMLFLLEWFLYYETEPRDLLITTTVDPANEEALNRGETDWNVVLTTGKSLTTGNIYVLEASRGKWTPSELLNTIFDHQKRWSSVKVGIETVQYQKSLIHWTMEMMRKRNQYFLVEQIQHSGRSKLNRIMGLQPLHAAKRVFYRHHMVWLVNELLMFPYGKHDDGADALSMHLPMWALTEDPEEDEDKPLNDPLSLDGAELELTRKWDEQHRGNLVEEALAKSNDVYQMN